ncbi:MAG TPA: hypothetical protein VGK78_10845 [Nocardioides sp.]|uniref:hypothetical protein n=1 Tax=Nocardioides sp. TaxID=35761 RepID=UPI002F41D147
MTNASGGSAPVRPARRGRRGGVDPTKHARDRRLVLHIGLHKTATTFLQNVLSTRRYDLLQEGVLYPSAGTSLAEMVKTREGAQSGHILFTRPGDRQRRLVWDLVHELPESARTVLVSSENFTHPGVDATPEQHLQAFQAFGSIEVILVVRRQDDWLESYYKQQVDQYGNFETRAFDAFLKEDGPTLLDFHARFEPWRQLVGPENFHVLSYDDLGGGEAICRRVLEIVGVTGPLLDSATQIAVPGYTSVRAIDTVGLRILNSYRLEDRDTRIRTALAIYAIAPRGDIELMTPEMRAGVQALCAPINERIEAEWFRAAAPAFRFGRKTPAVEKAPTESAALIEYIDRVIELCETARLQPSRVSE